VIHNIAPLSKIIVYFFRIIGGSSHPHNRQHQNLLDHIRRTSLDAFWSREPVTIRELTRMFHEELKVGQTLGFYMFLHPVGPFLPRYEEGVAPPFSFCIKQISLDATK
jgi:hypothetical protein